MPEGPASPKAPQALGQAGPSPSGDPRRALPAVGALLGHPAWPEAFPPQARTERLRPVLQAAREALASPGAVAPSPEALVAQALAQGPHWPERRRVLNGTGVLLHTNLGRAPLAPQALAALADLGGGFLDLELDLDRGTRGSRHAVASAMLCALTGAEAALVVNNGAAGVLLAATALAAGREVVCSRGELVAIGGGFRVHEVLASAGAKLVEVGATNRTTAEDWRQAIGPDTAALWRTHRSNFTMEGFVEELPRQAWVAIAQGAGLPAVEDLGHGLLHPLPASWGGPEATVQVALAAGVDVVIVSADKLLGGPQAGLVLGKAELVARLAKHPLMRALRPDKLSLVALEATLALWGQPQAALQAIPTWRLALRQQAQLQAWAEALLPQVQAAMPGWRVGHGPSEGAMGGGTLPGRTLPSWALRMSRTGEGPEALAEALRQGQPALLGRLEGPALCVDLLAMDESEGPALVAALAAAAARRT